MGEFEVMHQTGASFSHWVACSVIKPGRSFLRRMIELLKGVCELHYRVRLNAGFRFDLKCFLPIWNGLASLQPIVLGVAVWGTVQYRASVIMQLW